VRGVCQEAGCPEPPTYRGRCRAHARKVERTYNRVGKTFYSTKRWKLTRRRVLTEQPLCPCGELATHVDHIIPLPTGEAYDRANLQGLCARCHGLKTKREQESPCPPSPDHESPRHER
jgi:5-methylcytosine-specific restriction protein A